MDVRSKLPLLALGLLYSVSPAGGMGFETCSEGIVTEFIAFEANSTYLETPRYPERYTKEFRCGVLISAEQPSGVVRIQVYNSSMQSPCANNNAKVYDGLTPSASLLATWCADTVSTVTSTGRNLFFQFTANSNITDEGLIIEFTSGTLNPLPTTVAPTTAAPTTIAPTTTTVSSSAGAIAGGVVGGLLGVAVLVCGILAIVYFVKKNKGQVSSEPKVTTTQVKEMKDKQNDNEAGEKVTVAPLAKRPVSRNKSSLAFREASNLSSGTPLDHRSMRTGDSLRDSPIPFTPTYSTTPPRTPKGSVRLIESRLRLNSEMGSPATPPPSHREAIRSSNITIASIHSSAINQTVALDGAGQSPVIMEEIP